MLTPKKKLTKKELKHDPLLDSLEKGKEFYEANSKQILSGGIAVLLIMLLGWGWFNSRETTNNEAMLASTKATLAAVADLNENATAELEQVVNEYAGNSNISQSEFQLGIARMNAGDYSGAREMFSQLAQSSDSQLQQAGKLKLAYINEKELNFAEAGALYLEVAEMGSSIVSKYAKLQAGYAYLAAGDNAQASRITTELIADEPVGKFKEYVKYLEGKVMEK